MSHPNQDELAMLDSACSVARKKRASEAGLGLVDFQTTKNGRVIVTLSDEAAYLHSAWERECHKRAVNGSLSSSTHPDEPAVIYFTPKPA